MDHSINTHTIARTPITKNRFPKLGLKKNIKSCPQKCRKRDEREDLLCKRLNSIKLSPPISSSSCETPPFVTKHRPPVRSIPSYIFNSGTDSSNNNSGAEVKLSDSKSFESTVPNTHSTPAIKTEERTPEVVNDSLPSPEIFNKSLKSPEIFNKSLKSPERAIPPEMMNLMDKLYGNEWISTPGLFKKTKSRVKPSSEVKNEIEGTATVESSDDEEKIIAQSFYDLDESSFLINKKKVRTKNPLTESSDSNDEVKPFKPSKLNFNVSDSDREDALSDKENVNKPIKKKVLKKTTKNVRKNDIENVEKIKKNDIKTTELENIQKYSFMASLSDNLPSWRRDIKAQHYRDNFKKKKEELVKVLFKTFNENVFDSKLDPKLNIIWSSTLNKTAGRAHNKIVRSKVVKDGTNISRRSHVELSIKVLDTAPRLRDTLIHELCHVATWLIDGQLHDSHGPYWKSWVAKALRKYPELGSIPVCHSFDIHFKYSYKCMKCGYKINRHSKSIDTTKKRCGYCYGVFECILNKKTKDGTVVSTPVQPKKTASGFALYVKENYCNVRSGSTPHKAVMQLLSRQYAKIKLQPGENPSD